VPLDGTSRRGETIALAALTLLILALSVTPTTNNDIFLHLKTGATILETGRVPHVDDYSALAGGRPYVAHEWLSAVVFRLAERLAGLNALIVLKTAVACLLGALLYAAARTLGASPSVTIPCLALVMILAAARIMERPHIFSYLLAAAFLLRLARRRRDAARTPLWPFLPLQVTWANLHGGFVLGPTLLGLAAAGKAIDGLLLGLAPEAAGRSRAEDERRARARGHLREAGRLAAVTAALVACCLVNPYGANLLKFPFALTSSSFMGEIYEWQPPLTSDFAATYMVRYYLLWAAIGIGVLLVALVRAARRQAALPGGAFPVLLFGVLLALSLRMQRNVTDFALGTLPGIAAVATSLRRPPGDRRTRRSVLPATALALIGLAGWFAWSGYAYRPSSRRSFGLGVGRNIPVAAADYLEANGIRGNAFNSYSAGAYLVYRFYPAVRVAMDSRNDVYGADLYGAYTRALVDPDALARMLRGIDASFVFLEWPTPPLPGTLALLRGLGGWTLVYFDDSFVILVRRDGPWAAVAGRDGYSILDPTRFAPLKLRPEEVPGALEEATRAVRASRGAAIARVMRVNALLALGRQGEARDEEARILADRPPLSYIYTFLGILRLAGGDTAEAGDRFRQALAINPGDRVASEGLRRTGLSP